MSSKREQIVSAFVQALSGTAGVSSNIYRSRQDAIAADETPALVVLLESEEPEEYSNGFVEARLLIVVEVHARATATPDKSADATVVSVHSKLTADPTLGGRAIDVSDAGTEWDFDQSDQALVVVRMRFGVWYRHQRNSLTA